MSVPAQSFVLPLRLGKQTRDKAGAPARQAGSVAEPAFDQLKKTLSATLRQIHKPGGAILFVSGAQAPTNAVAEVVGQASKDLVALVVPATGILTETAEVEGPTAVAGIVWSGKATAKVGSGGSEVARALAAAAPAGGTVAAFCSADGFDTAEISALAKGRDATFGAGTPSSIVLVERGRITSDRVGALHLAGASAPLIESSPACKLVSEPMIVTKMDRTMVLELDGKPALDVLGARAGGGRHGGLILVAVHDPADPSRFLVRPIRGIDPARHAISVAADLEEGARVSFLVRDVAAAKEGLGEAARKAERRATGSTPTFALYLSCAGRGRALYGESDVDIRILKKRFPKIPIAGMHSAFEIVPWGPGEARMQLMSGVLALFRAAS
jgi:small ligand-binding sensory domain FIST